MPTIEHEATVNAAPEAIFALISQVEPFVELTESVTKIEALGEKRYRWHVRVAGFKFQIEVQVTEIEPPSYFAWQSITGIPNHGSYTLTPSEDGTRLRFALEYRLRNRLLEKAFSGTTRAMVHRLSEEIIGNVERKLA
jgi:uncharacterized membrane protein